ncbi:ABC transporter [Carbonactinospora thermoautotrophica]|uniref:Transport permease protein n=1 Tax=Carbonactinospora thermoautotrophica TaxID=1469144 RepID=A0A132NHH4_9ACTN|nr:ABC transporter permease [Carbonactinospora thermoautotrophica]KWX04672.1 ABC transporter [Carbonactinospora thermoautotrophica]KWX09581.1 ABC transporter [Carbonactinospora thermoautotrophica]
MSTTVTPAAKAVATLAAASSPSPLRRGALYWAFADGLVLAGRQLRKIPRVPEQLVFATVQPILFVLLFRYVFGGAIHPEGTTYPNFLMAGVFVQTVVIGSAATCVGIAEDLQCGLIDRFRSLPMARSAVLTGRTLADAARNLFTVAVMFGVGLVVGFRPQGSPLAWLEAIVLLLLIGYAFSWVGATIGLAVRTVEAAQSAGLSWVFPLTFLSSAFVPTETMPGWLRAFAENQPITAFIEAVRALLLDRPVGSSVAITLAWTIGVLCVFAPLSVALYRRVTTR